MNPLLIRRRGMMKAQQGGLPYDAEIEYLESTGTQYIDTLIYGNQDTEIQATFMFLNDIDAMVLGDNTASSRQISLYRATYANCRFDGSVDEGNFKTSTPKNSILQLTQNKNGIFVNGVIYASFTGVTSFTTGGTIYVYWSHSSSARKVVARLYDISILENGVKILDLIPVRVGSVGYMYDRVSGQLFGNQGTGDFVLGPDKN